MIRLNSDFSIFIETLIIFKIINSLTFSNLFNFNKNLKLQNVIF
jgi:hypothetical protein